MEFHCEGLNSNNKRIISGKLEDCTEFKFLNCKRKNVLREILFTIKLTLLIGFMSNSSRMRYKIINKAINLKKKNLLNKQKCLK